MIITRTPLRISFVGGGSDLPSFYRDHGGKVISTSITKYVTINFHKFFQDTYRLVYSQLENVSNLDDIKHPLIREVLKYYKVSDGVEIHSMADITSKGSGLGSSSAFTIGLAHAAAVYQNVTVTKSKLAELACEIEIKRCGAPIGKQDQYACAFGGMNEIEFSKDGSVQVRRLNLDADFTRNLEKSLIFFNTGAVRSAAIPLNQQAKKLKTTSGARAQHRIVQLVDLFHDAMLAGDIQGLGAILDENWQLKQSLNGDAKNLFLQDIYSAAIEAGAIGGKLLGAGAGGFFMFLAPIEKHVKIKQALSKLVELSVQFDTRGTEVIYQHD